MNLKTAILSKIVFLILLISLMPDSYSKNNNEKNMRALVDISVDINEKSIDSIKWERDFDDSMDRIKKDLEQDMDRIRRDIERDLERSFR